MRVFTTKLFRRFARDKRIAEEALCTAALELATGLIHANLGGSVFKQRIARKGEGRSGGFRTIVFFRAQQRAFFVYGFAKNDQENIERADLFALKKLAKEMLDYDDETLNLSLHNGELREICSEKIP